MEMLNTKCDSSDTDKTTGSRLKRGYLECKNKKQAAHGNSFCHRRSASREMSRHYIVDTGAVYPHYP